VLQFNEEENKAIYEHLQELPKHREFLSGLRTFTFRLTRKRWNGTLKVNYSKV